MLFRRRQRELEEELRSHLEMSCRDRRERGEDEQTARLNARRELGNVGLVAEVTRDMWTWTSLERLLQDLRYGWRVLWRSPGYTFVALFSLALGIGVNTAIFSLINAVMLKTLPVRDPAPLAIVGNPAAIGSLSQGSGMRTDFFSYPFYKEFRRRNQVFVDVYATGRSEYLNVATEEHGKTIAQTVHPSARLVTGNYFSILGVVPTLGRAFTDEETQVPGSAPVVVISYGYWEQQFGRDPNIIGRKLILNGAPFTVIGIAPRAFTGDIVGTPIDIWLPVTMKAQANPGHDYLNDPETHWLLFMGRLKPGVSITQAGAQVDALGKHIYKELYQSRTPADEYRQLAQKRFEVTSGARGFSRIRRDFSEPLLVLMGVVAFVLLICCVNVANLQLARSAARTREMSLRLAVGAGRGRLIRQLLTESLMLAFGGGVLGLLFSVWAAQLFIGIASRKNRLPLDLHVDPRILVFTAGVALLAGVLFGLAPAFQSARIDLVSRLRETSAGQSTARFGRTLVALQVALSMILLVGAGLFVRTLENLKNVNVGYARQGLALAELDFKAAGYRGPAVLTVARRLIDSIAATPGVKAVTVSENGLFSGTDSLSDDGIEGYTPRTDADRSNHSDRVGPDYFQIVGMPILAGRGITAQDVQNAAPVAIVTQSMAQFYFPHESPIGRHITDPESKPVSYTIVGVVGDVKQSDLRQPVQRRFFLSYFQPRESDPIAAMNLEIRTDGAGSAALQSIRQKIAGVDPKIPILDLSTADQLIDDTLGEEHLVASLSTVFGGLALILAGMGLYGVMSYRTVRRTSEIGIRMALGAGRGSVMAMILGETGVVVGFGVAIGILIALLLAVLLKRLFYGLSGFEVLPVVVATLVIAIAATIAALVPAWRASRIDPTIALRTE